MGILDDFGRKMTQAKQITVQKTKEMTDSVKINAQIAQCEGQLNKAYQEIGRQYAALHQTDFESELSGQMEMVLSLESQISDLKRQLQEIKGTVRCQNCGTEIPQDAAFCHNCGTPVVRQAAEQSRETAVCCPACGAHMSDTLRFCTSCGSPLQASDQQS